MNNFHYITPEEYVRKHGEDFRPLAELQELAAAPASRCFSCLNGYAWKLAGVGMCFSCTTGEADASDDYELIAPEPMIPFTLSELYGPIPCERDGCTTGTHNIWMTEEEYKHAKAQTDVSPVRYVFTKKVGEALCKEHQPTKE